MSHEFWFKEYHTEHNGIFFRIERILFQKKTPFQQIDIVESPVFGKVLLLDGLVMTTELDEFVYHEMLVHPAMVLHPSPKRVLVIGGGDGGTVRELIKYQEVEEIIQSEIDREVVEAARKYLPELSSGFDDPRVKIFFEDGVKFVKESDASVFDLIFVDSSDPVGPAAVLYGDEFIESVHRALRPDGIVVFQSESPFTRLDIIKSLFDGLAKKFKVVKPYLAPMPGYPDGTWSFLMAMNENHDKPVRELPSGLKYVNEDILKSAFALPNFVKNRLYD